jgi:hypothetical protein
MVLDRPWTAARIRAHLLQAPPFLDSADATIWATKGARHIAVSCPHKPELLLALVHALQRYGATVDVAQYVPDPDTLAQIRHDAVWEVIQEIVGYHKLRATRRLSSFAQAHIAALHRTTLQRYERFLLQLSEGLTTADYAEMAKDLAPPQPQALLEAALIRAFQRYGPAQRRGGFSAAALYDAIAALVRHFGIDHRRRRTIADRLRKTQHRARQTAPYGDRKATFR